MNAFFSDIPGRIASRLTGFIEAQRDHSRSLGVDDLSLFERLLSFSTSGKMVRGSLVIAASRLHGGKEPICAVDCAASVELCHSASLIHDDIIDRDEQRRGKATIHALYGHDAESLEFSDPSHYGAGMGICAGDVAIFLAYQILSEMGCPPDRKVRILSLISSEARMVALAQMHDIHNGALRSPKDLTELSILQVYRFKTARYTFSVPLMVGAILAGLDEASEHLLDRLGEKLGVLFQLRDDELGLFGKAGETGKPVGSDIREGKKTLHYVVARDMAASGEFPGEDWQKLDRAWGNSELSDAGVEFVQRILEEHGVVKRVRIRMSELASESNELLSAPLFRNPVGVSLRELVEYNLDRRK